MEKSDSLQALRAIAFLGIFFIHSHFIINWAGAGVSTFFVLAGFLCEKKHGASLKQTDTKQSFFFTWRRIRRIYPLHIIIMILWAAWKLLADHSIHSTVILALEVILNVTLTQSWIPNTNINACLNGVAWFLSSIAVHYFLFSQTSILMHHRTSKRKPLIILAIFMVLQVSSCWLLKTVFNAPKEIYGWFSYSFPLFRFVDFYAGMCLAHLTDNVQPRAEITFRSSIIEAIAVIITILIYKSISLPKSGNLHAALYNGSTIYIIISIMWVWLFFNHGGIITHLLSVKPLVSLGNLTPYLFLIHFPVTQFDGWLLDLTNNTYIITGVELAISILLAIIYVKMEPHVFKRLKLLFEKEVMLK